MDEIIELLVFDKPDKMIDTQYGRISYLDWLEKEKNRKRS